MEKEFIPYEEALALKELGFDEPCYKYIYIGDTGTNCNHFEEVLPSMAKNYNEDSLCISQTTFSQAFRWFREKYNLATCIEYYAQWNFEIFRIDDKIAEVQDDVNVDYTFKGGTYQEAELECLRKLIEVVKEQK